MPAQDYINPIISAWVAGQNAAQQKAELAQRGTQFTESQKQQKQLEEERLQKEQEFRDAQLENAHQTLELSKELAAYKHSQETLQALQEGRSGGMNTDKIQQFLQNGSFQGSQYRHLPGTGPAQAPPQQAPQQNAQISSAGPQPAAGGAPGSDQPISFSPSDLGPSPEQRMQMAAQGKGQEAAAVSNAQQPNILAQIGAQGQQQQTLEGMRTAAAKDAAELERTFKAGESAKERQNRLDITKLDRGTQFSVAAMHETGENKRALYNFGLGLPPEAGASKGALNNLQDQLATGEIDYDPKNHMQFIAQSANDEHGVSPLGTKKLEELKQLNTLNDYFDQMKDIVKQGAKSQVGAVAQGMLGAHWPSDIQNKFDELMGRVQSVATAAEGFSGGRLLSGQFKAESGSMPNSSHPVYQNLERIDAIQRTVLNKEQNSILAGVPQIQRELLKVKNGLNIPDVVPDWVKALPQKTKSGRPINIQDTIKNGTPTYDEK